MRAVGVFLMTALVDWVWAAYTVYVARGSHLRASFSAMLIYGIGGVSTVMYVNEPGLIVFAVAGAFVGTYFASKHLNG